jgi:hypothetical protein
MILEAVAADSAWSARPLSRDNHSAGTHPLFRSKSHNHDTLHRHAFRTRRLLAARDGGCRTLTSAHAVRAAPRPIAAVCMYTATVIPSRLLVARDSARPVAVWDLEEWRANFGVPGGLNSTLGPGLRGRAIPSAWLNHDVPVAECRPASRMLVLALGISSRKRASLTTASSWHAELCHRWMCGRWAVPRYPSAHGIAPKTDR